MGTRPMGGSAVDSIFHFPRRSNAVNNDKNWFDDVLAASKEAAGLPSDWGVAPSPLTDDEEREDAPPAARLRADMATSELLPYGHVVVAPDGQQLAVEKLTAGPLEAPGGGICVCDPVSMEWLGGPIQLDLRGDALPVELAVLRRATPRGDVFQGAVAVLGDTSAVTSWIPLSEPGARLEIDKGCGGFTARNHLIEVASVASESCLPTSVEGLVPIELDGRVVGVLFDPGNGPGAYELMLGRGRGALPVALLVDLGVLPRG